MPMAKNIFSGFAVLLVVVSVSLPENKEPKKTHKQRNRLDALSTNLIEFALSGRRRAEK